MPLTRRNLMESALAITSLPGAADYFLNWVRDAAPEMHHTMVAAPPDPPPLANYQPAFFNQADFQALQSICEILIPTDDLPGAREARTPLYIDYVLSAAAEYAPERQQQWRTAMQALRDLGFHSAGEKRRAELVAEMAKPETDTSIKHPAYAAYRLIKAENAFAFYSSRAGLIDNLEYQGNTFHKTFPGCDHPEHHNV